MGRACICNGICNLATWPTTTQAWLPLPSYAPGPLPVPNTTHQTPTATHWPTRPHLAARTRLSYRTFCACMPISGGAIGASKRALPLPTQICCMSWLPHCAVGTCCCCACAAPYALSAPRCSSAATATLANRSKAA